jgi:hypothetical protein
MPPTFCFLISPQRCPKTSAVCTGMAKKRCRPYCMTFPNREMSYGMADDVSWLYRTGFRVSYRFGAGNRGGGFPAT